MLSSQSASNPKILLFLLFCFKCRNSFCLQRSLASSAGYSCRRLQLYGRPPPSDEWVLRTRPPRISIAPHQLVRRRDKFLRSEFNFLKLSLGDLLLTPPSIPTFLSLSRTLIEVERQQKSEKERRPSSSEREAEATEAFFLLFRPLRRVVSRATGFHFWAGEEGGKGGESLKGGSVDEFWGAERRRKWAKKSPSPLSLPAKCLSADLSRLKVATYTSLGEREGGKNVSQQEMRKPAPPSSVSNAVNQVEEEGRGSV